MKIVVVFLILINIFFADDDYDKKHYHYYSKDLTFLNLSSEQKSKIKEILKEYKYDYREYKEHKQKAISKKQELFSGDIFDEKEIIKQNSNISDIATKIEIKLLKQIHAILTKKQREIFISYIDEWEIE